MKFAKLQKFRQETYKHLGKGHNATEQVVNVFVAQPISRTVVCQLHSFLRLTF